MATKIFCDVCGKDITHLEISGPPISIRGLWPEESIARDFSCWVGMTFLPNPPEMCEECLKKAWVKAAKAILEKLGKE
jgi:hypothetical protein